MKTKYGVSADYFAIGVIGYEFMTGRVNFKFRGDIMGKVEKKLEIKFWLNKFNRRDMKFLKGDLLKQLILSIKYFYHF